MGRKTVNDILVLSIAIVSLVHFFLLGSRALPRRLEVDMLLEEHNRDNVENLMKKIDELQWKLDLCRARPFQGITVPNENGLASACIPKQLQSQFGAGNFYVHQPPNPPLPPEHNSGQVGQFVFDHMEIQEDARPIWTREIWDHLMNELSNGRSITVPGYPNSTEDLQAALGHVMIDRTFDAAVFSAISPWAEATLKNYYNKKVRLSSVDFNPCVLKGIHEIVECKNVLSLKENSQGPSYDLIVSYSGIEHDGLGRYGDPVNPDGDLSAMREFWLHLKPGGYLLLAVPISNPSQTDKSPNGVYIDHWGNGKLRVMRHRLFGAQRLAKMFTGFSLVGYAVGQEYFSVKNDWRQETRLLGGQGNGAHHPVMVLKKDSSIESLDHLLSKQE